MSTALFIDGNALMHRSFHAVKFNPTFQGKPAGMIYGMGASLLQAINAFSPSVLAVGFDTKEKTFRHEMDEDYKAQRQKAPDEFYEQIPLVYEMLESFEIPVLRIPGFEADDIVGTLAYQFAHKDYQAIILSNDLDYCQLLSDRILLARPNGQITLDSLVSPSDIEAKLGIPIYKIIDYKAIIGDSSDNYKGINGIGPKGAAALLNQYESLEGIYEHLEDLKPKIREKFEAYREYAFHCQTLAQIKLDVPIREEIAIPTPINLDQGAVFFEKVGFPSLAKRALNMNKNNDQSKNIEPENNSKKAEEEDQMTLF